MMETNRKLNRREALKRMGLLVAGSVAAASGTLALSSCSASKPCRIIFYFTGTGNCLYVARQLANAETTLLSIPQLVKQGKYDFEADEIGIVYPIYGHMPPYMVRQFIQKARLKAGYKFAVLTFGARKCNAVELWNEAARKAGHTFDYITTMIMVDNWLPNFDMNEQMKLDKHIPESLQRINTDLAARRLCAVQHREHAAGGTVRQDIAALCAQRVGDILLRPRDDPVRIFQAVRKRKLGDIQRRVFEQREFAPVRLVPGHVHARGAAFFVFFQCTVNMQFHAPSRAAMRRIGPQDRSKR